MKLLFTVASHYACSLPSNVCLACCDNVLASLGDCDVFYLNFRLNIFHFLHLVV